MGAACAKADDSTLDQAEDIAERAIAAHRPPAETDGARPTLMVLFGGIGAGKTTAQSLALEALGKQAEDFVAVGVDDLIELMPEYVDDVESGDAARMKAAYMKHRAVAKAAVDPAITKAVNREYNLVLEWTNEDNLLVRVASGFGFLHIGMLRMGPTVGAGVCIRRRSQRRHGRLDHRHGENWT